MKTTKSIPKSKLSRASKLVATGAKVGMNYLKYYGKRTYMDAETAKGELNEENAEDIYDTLKDLKGSALKVAQMLSMEKNLLPKAYTDKFSLSQFSVPPLSPALVMKTLKQYLGSSPLEIFDKFSYESMNAASIGQVHLAEKDGKKLAVKVQYPGVAESITSDLNLVKPIASKMFNFKMGEIDQYFEEVRSKLLEETDYTLELKQSLELSEACAILENVKFPKYYEELSSSRVLAMDFMKGSQISNWIEMNPSEQDRNKIAQALWDFYMYQIHVLKKVHADPHPGNFLVDTDTIKLIAIDFGCIKDIPFDFYTPYFELAEPSNLNNPELFNEKLLALEILKPDDTEVETAFFTSMFHKLLSLFTKPLQDDYFDFSDEGFVNSIGELATKYANDAELKKQNANRGSRHFIYINRTFFGLYNLMFDLKATKVKTNNFSWK
jgi:predicted unusual protein kinase regulating ubiquinone biosynthesis (AarF/ABC1/UbiB family)